MVKLLKKWLRKWLEIEQLDKDICAVSDMVEDLKSDVETTHNEYTDLYDTTEKRYEALTTELALIKDNGITTRSDVIDEWLNGKEVIDNE